uniref:LysM and putative peptidoglycan-binding domain-containing protein 1 n=1 Tax=Tetraodon nigroviridis TaxID=99883 RepID=H3CKY6_TETNG
MSEEEPAVPSRGNGLLRTGRARSYGSLVRSPISPVRQRRVEHQIQPGETLQGLALKYGVSMEQIKRANRMYTNDSIHLKKSLSIPVLLDTNSGLEPGDGGDHGRSDRQRDGGGAAEELSPEEFLKRLDGLIHQSKQAAVRGCRDAEEVCSGGPPAWRPLAGPGNVLSSCGGHGAVPLTVTRLTRNLRDQEDEIFQL